MPLIKSHETLPWPQKIIMCHISSIAFKLARLWYSSRYSLRLHVCAQKYRFIIMIILLWPVFAKRCNRSYQKIYIHHHNYINATPHWQKLSYMSPRYYCWALSQSLHLVICFAIHFQTVERPLSGLSQCRAVTSNTNVHPTASSDPSSNHKLSHSPNELVSTTRNCWRFGCPCLKKDCYYHLLHV